MVTEKEFLPVDPRSGQVTLSFPLPLVALRVRGRFIASYAVRGVHLSDPTPAEAEAKNQRLTTRYEKKLADKTTENDRLNKAADALGKAITVLHKYGDPSGRVENN